MQIGHSPVNDLFAFKKCLEPTGSAFRGSMFAFGRGTMHAFNQATPVAMGQGALRVTDEHVGTILMSLMPDLPNSFTDAIRDRYVLEREIGAGGMATVHLARDVRHNRHVAIKVLKPELAASIGSDRFLKEIEIAARLTHPHIIPLHDSGEAAGFLFYVMPYIDGETLRARLLREKRVDAADALEIVEKVGDALSYAHRQEVLHRDIKPENIMFSEGHPMVADFGIARAVSTAGGATLTRTGLAIGTPGYMSPEQAIGARELDHRTDVFSLGCVLYEMLVGETPSTWMSDDSLRTSTLTGIPDDHRTKLSGVDKPIEKALVRALAMRATTVSIPWTLSCAHSRARKRRSDVTATPKLLR